jgi:hypothetical protein
MKSTLTNTGHLSIVEALNYLATQESHGVRTSVYVSSRKKLLDALESSSKKDLGRLEPDVISAVLQLLYLHFKR